MKAEWRGVSALGGIGSFLGFLVAVLLYEPLQEEAMVYLIYVGLAVGAALAVPYGERVSRLFATACATPLGIITALLLVFLWVPGNPGPAPLYLGLGMTLGVMLFVKPSGIADVVLVPLAYLGGFVMIMLALKDYPPLQGSEFAVPILFRVSGSAAVLAFFGSLARWGFEFARRLTGGNV
ncbi:hypothetical protein [Thermococcus sp.]|uniref:hypothetical protein n=1 Tax=Thermococcus sp. TaxID=35749 RepID=UPI002601D569|nr:hypothetical protein [Thermococcus sp.]